MRLFLEFPVILLITGLAHAGAQDGVKKPEVATGEAPKSDPPKEKLDLPVPKGQPQKGLRIPIYSPGGKLMMNFQIGVATWVDDDNINMGDLHVETFKEDGAGEFEIDLPDSVFNLRSRELSAKANVKIRRGDFQITGNSMTFNTETKVGKFGGGVKMVIFDARASLEKKGEAGVPSVEVKPIKDEKK